MNIILLSTTTAVFFGYIALVWFKFGVLPSISDSYYYFKHRPGLFFFAMFGTGFPVIVLAETSLLFFSGCFIVLVGTAGAFHRELTGKVHVIGAVGSIVLGMVSLWVDYGYWYISVGFTLLMFLITFFRVNNHTWWIEILAYVCIVGVLWVN